MGLHILDDIKVTAILCGVLYFFALQSPFLDEHYSIAHTGYESYTVLAVLGSILLIVHMIERLGIVDTIERLKTGDNKKDHTTLSWIAFWLSGIIDNVAATDSVVKSQDLTEEENVTAQNTVNAANAGGAGSVIGDSTTVYLWQKDMVDPILMLFIFIPSMVNNWIGTYYTYKKVKEDGTNFFDKKQVELVISHLVVSTCCLLLIPFLKIFYHFEVHNAAMIALLCMGTYFATTGVSFFHEHDEDNGHSHDSSKLASFYEILKPAILMALIVLMMNQLGYSGLLGWTGEQVSGWHILIVLLMLGFLSVIVDNMAVVAMAVHGLARIYPAGSFFWYGLAYCAGTAGSLNLPGSSSGVTLKKRVEAACKRLVIEPTVTTLSYLRTVGGPNLAAFLGGFIVICIMYYTIGHIFVPFEVGGHWYE